jgi:methylenetetrahydrofolate dehydrogenase (NADP+)/methenyltetrahydrofolate cyclohydrolase
MSAKIINGVEIAKSIRAEIKRGIEELATSTGVTPGLAVVLVGEDPASQVYVRTKSKACAEVGIYEETKRLPADTSEDDLLRLIRELNAEKKFHGILVQLPLPKHIDTQKVLNAVAPEKDVDGFHPINIGKLVAGEDDCFLPCTPAGIQQLLVRSGNSPEGKHVVVVGRSNIVGKPIANILVQKKECANATVTICHTATKDLGVHTRTADILIVAAGRPRTITANMVKDGAVVIDVGVNRVPDASAPKGYRLVGDVDFEGVKEKASAITPVPGGVGPMTVTMLLNNVLRAAKMQTATK